MNDFKEAFFHTLSVVFSRERERYYIKICKISWIRQLDNMQKISLEQPFTMEEIVISLKDSKGTRAGCLKAIWPSIKNSMMSFFQDFYENGSLPAASNSSFISLIPKCFNLSKITDFRSISLINSLPKLLLKVLVKFIIGNIVAE